MKRYAILVITALSLSVVFLGFQSESRVFFTLNADKKIVLPVSDDYRTWELIGTGMVPDDLNRNRAIFPGVHLVFIDPVALKHRREKGFFPDGTIIVMENYRQNGRKGVSGIGYFESGPLDLLISVKDRRLFSGSGWAYYLFRAEDIAKGMKESAPQPRSDCQACHFTAAKDDEVFVSFYPRLNVPGKRTKQAE